MAQLVVSAVGAYVGFLIGGPQGAAIGWSIGGALGSTLASPQKVKGPLSTDLKQPKLTYGTPVPRIYGRQRTAGHLVWSSEKRPVATTTESGGKGGPGVETTTYTYNIDCLYMVAIDSDVIAVTRAWRNGEVIYSVLAEADADTVTASLNTDAWAAIELFDGDPAQLPWSVYETAVGAANAVAYRHRSTIGIEMLNLGGFDQLPLMEFEVITVGTANDSEPATRFQTLFEDADSSDITEFDIGPGSIELNESSTIVDGDVSDHGGELHVDTSTTTDASSITWTNASFAPTGSDAMTVEFFSEWIETPNVHYTPFVMFNPDVSDPVTAHHFGYTGNAGRVTYDDDAIGQAYEGDSPVVGRTHYALVFGETTRRVYINGVKVFQTSSGGFYGAETLASFRVGLPVAQGGGQRQAYIVDSPRITFDELYTGDSFVPPTRLGPPSVGGSVWTVGVADLSDTVASECSLSGMDSGQFDVTELTDEVIGFATTGSPRQSIEALMAGFYFEGVCSDKLYFNMRGGASAATIPYADLAAGLDRATETPFDPVKASDEEVPSKIALTCPNLSADYEPGTEMGDRLATVGADTRQISLPVVFLPEQIKGRALAIALDARNSSITAEVSLSDAYAELEPTDTVTVIDLSGTAYRMRVMRESYADGVKRFSLCLDDPTALVTAGITSDERTPVINVPTPAETLVRLLDIPILRDADAASGLYAAFKSSGPGWPGGRLYSSADGLSWEDEATATETAVYGFCTTALGDWTGPRVIDEVNSVTVSIGTGTLASSTRTSVLNDQSINAAAIGVQGRMEVLQFISAELLSAGVYKLTRLLRGGRGTEWAMVDHLSSDEFTLLRPAGLRRFGVETPVIGVERQYNAVTLGRPLGSGTQQAFTDTGVDQKPFSPFDARVERDGSNNATITWQRRTRFSVRTIGPLGISIPLGEESEAYSTDVYDDDTFATVVRTIASTTPTASYSASDQTADGLTPGDPLNLRIYQISGTVGRGYPVEAEQ